MKPITFINSHPIQYFAPFYKYLNEQGVQTSAWYCSFKSANGSLDKEFGTNIKWDIPLLEGYDYAIFKNHSWKPSQDNGFFGLINLGMIRKLFSMPKSVIVVHGWHYFTHLIILLLGKLRGHTICVRCDLPQKQEVLKNGWKQVVKRIGLKYLVFPRIDYFLYIGHQNRLFYKSFGVPDNRLLSCPYSVDNNRFRMESEKLKPSIPQIKKRMGIPASGKVILYAAKYIEKKRPIDLLKAFIHLNDPGCWLVMVGEGKLREEMEKLIHQYQVKQVVLTGFKNQTEISEYYAISDLFIMCSSVGEHWGLSVNEAMNFNLPLILSDLTGCSDDLVKEGDNGYVFKTGDVNQLAEKMKHILFENKLSWNTSSEHIIDQYSFHASMKSLKNIVA